MNNKQDNSSSLRTRPNALVRGLKSVGAWIGNTVPVRLLLDAPAGWLGFLGVRNFSGQVVTVDSTLQLSTAWACVRLISELISTLPIDVYKRIGGRKRLDDAHPLHYLLSVSPNADSTPAVFWQACLASMLLRDGMYVQARRDVTDKVTSLTFLVPDMLGARETDGRRWYTDPITGLGRWIPERELWYTPSFTTNGITGLAPTQYGANVFGGAMAADKASSETFKSGMRASGLVTMDHVMKPDQRDDVRKHTADAVENGGILVLEKGASFQQLTMTPQDSQLLTTRQFNVEEICRWFRVPPFMVGHNDKASGYPASLEQQNIMFLQMVLTPYLVRIEQSINKFLFNQSERGKQFVKFNLDGLLRGDSAARAAFYKAGIGDGWMSRAEVREKENMPPVNDENVDKLTVQMQVVPLEGIGKQEPAEDVSDATQAPPPEAEATPGTTDLVKTLRKLSDDLLETKD